MLLLVFINSCSKDEKEISIIKETDQNLEMIAAYKEAHEALDQGDPYFAAKKFSEAELLFPQSSWAPRSALMASYSYYLQNDYLEALMEHLCNTTKHYWNPRSFDEIAGTFSQTDTFLRMDKSGTDFTSRGFPVRDEYSWDVSYDWSSEGTNTLTINGTVQGFAAFSPASFFSGQATTAIDNAENYIAISQTGRIEFIKSVASGRAVHPAIDYNLQSANYNTNIAEGNIGYSYTYTTKAPLNTGVLSETINVTRTNPSQVFAEQQVLGRQLGPVLQDIGTQTSYTEELSIEAVVLPQPGDSGEAISAGGTYEPFLGAPDYGPIIDSHGKSISGRYNDEIAIFKTNDTESFDVKTGRYTRNVGYIYTECPS